MCRHAKIICDMIMHSKPLFEAFAGHCSERTVTLYQEKCAALAVAARRDRSDASSQSSAEPTASHAVVLTAGQPSRNAKFNYAAVLQRVLMALQETNRKIKSYEPLHDFATVLDRGKRVNQLDNAAVKSVFGSFVEMYKACLAMHEKSFKALKDEYWGPRGGEPSPSKGAPLQNSASSTKVKKQSATASKAPTVKATKSVKKQFINHDDEEEDTNSESGGDGLSDTEHSSSGRSGSVKRSRLSKGSAPRKRVRKAKLSDDSDGESDEEESGVGKEVLESMIQEALDIMRNLDANDDFSLEVKGIVLIHERFVSELIGVLFVLFYRSQTR